MIQKVKETFIRILDFFKKEKFYTLLFLLVLALSLTNHFLNDQNPDEEALSKPSQEYQNLEQAEVRMKEQLKDVKSIEAFFKENPSLAISVQTLVILASIIFLIGGTFLIGFWFRPQMRQKIANLPFFDPATWNFAMLFKVGLLFIVVSLLISGVLNVVQKYILTAWSFNFVMLLQTTLIDLACLVLMIKQIKNQKGGWASLGFRIPENGFLKEVLYGFLGYCCVFPIFIVTLGVLLIIVSLTGYEPEAHPLVNIFLEEETRSPWVVYYSVFLAIIIAPILEEVFFRGFCYNIFKKEWGVTLALMLSSSLFALIHQNIFAFLPIFALGFALAYLYEVRRSLVASVTMHIIHNSLFIAYFFIVKKVLTAV
jgi:membrane protease YdiL (CAAX protease family)